MCVCESFGIHFTVFMSIATFASSSCAFVILIIELRFPLLTPTVTVQIHCVFRSMFKCKQFARNEDDSVLTSRIVMTWHGQPRIVYLRKYFSPRSAT